MRLTKKKAIQIAIELWEWLAETGAKKKESWKGWEKYGRMSGDCALCEYDSQFDGGCVHCPYSNYFGFDCCRWQPSSFENDDGVITPFDKWEDARTTSARKKYASEFLAQLKELL